MSSLRNLRSNHSNSPSPSKQCDDMRVQLESPHTPIQQKPSLILNFEVSPPDQPMFEPTREASSSSSIDVRHSSPIAVPASAKQAVCNFHSTPPGPPFIVGTMPDSPAPLRKPSVQESILNHAITGTPDASPSSVDADRAVDPLPTPMPGTTLSLEDLAAPNASSSPPTEQKAAPQDYFARTAPKRNESMKHTDCVAITGKPSAPRNADIVTSARTTAAGVADDLAATLLPGKPEPLGPGEANKADVHNDRFMLDSSKRSEHDELRADLAYVVWDDPEIASEDGCQLQRRRSTWGRHTGLYDGTGYGGETAPTTPRPSMSDNTEDETEGTDLTVPEEAAPGAAALEIAAEPVKASAASEAESAVDGKETLQDIIRAYAGPMLYHEEAENAHAVEYSGDCSTEEEVDSLYAYPASMKAEVELSIRVMNRSLGG